MPFHLVFYNLLSHKTRTFLTVGSITIAVFLLCFLRTVIVSLQAGVDAAATSRLFVQSAVSLFVSLPISYQGKIEGVAGVHRVCKLQWFGAYYQEPSNFFAQFGVDADRFFEAYSEVKLIQGQQDDFRKNRTSCVIGKQIAEKYGFKIGDRVPLMGTIFPKLDGVPWEFEVAGVYESTSANVDNNTLWFHFSYLDESLKAGVAGGPQGVGVFLVALKEKANPIAVASKIDELFTNGPQRVQATTEAEFQRQFVTMLGSVPLFLTSIGGGVLFAIALAALNTMLMSARQRTHEFGVLKALGFTDSATFFLLLSESMLLCGLGGILGLALAMALGPYLGKAMSTLLPFFIITGKTLGMAFGLSVAIGFLAGIVPAIQAARLRCVEALRADI